LRKMREAHAWTGGSTSQTPGFFAFFLLASAMLLLT
jgi:hypothetical protein